MPDLPFDPKTEPWPEEWARQLRQDLRRVTDPDYEPVPLVEYDVPQEDDE